MIKKQTTSLTQEQAVALALILGAVSEAKHKGMGKVEPVATLPPPPSTWQKLKDNVNEQHEFLKTHPTGNEIFDLVSGSTEQQYDKRFAETMEMAKKANPNISDEDARRIAFEDSAAKFTCGKAYSRVYKDVNPETGIANIDGLGESIKNRASDILADATADIVREKLIEQYTPKQDKSAQEKACPVKSEIEEILGRNDFLPSQKFLSTNADHGEKTPNLLSIAPQQNDLLPPRFNSFNK